MLTNKAVVAVFALLAGGFCLPTSGCNNALPTDLAGRGLARAAMRDAPPATLPGGRDLSTIPNTWYCVRPWSPDREEQRRGMELFAWRLFIAINWPGRFDSQTSQWHLEEDLAALNGPEIYPRWDTWYTPKRLYEEFLALDTAKSQLPPETGWACNGDCLKSALEGSGFSSNSPALSEHKRVYDQNGHAVLYEIRVDESVRKTLQRAIQPADPRQPPPILDFQPGQCKNQGPANNGDQKNQTGAMAIKLAWKRLTGSERTSGRFLQRRASLPDCKPESPSCEVTLGLVGFHITHKPIHYPDWAWFTFEHVDNLAPPEPSHAPSFNDPGCDASTCCPNASQTDPGLHLCKTQITRVSPIDPSTQQLNHEMQERMRGERTVLQYYELIGAQYKHQSMIARDPDAKPETLRNSIIETYLVGPNRPPTCSGRNPCGPGPLPEASSCMGCHKAGAVKHDFIFIPQNDLCNCNDKEHRWLGDARCERLGVATCP